ncbi:hypothetical protein [Kitasatospora sp. NPDC001527]|uniref:hypothetical protein n=1 Tax=Kitasatospora sp. NPDC001527 TaxID=3154519 RepID=UPI003318E4CD
MTTDTTPAVYEPFVRPERTFRKDSVLPDATDWELARIALDRRSSAGYAADPLADEARRIGEEFTAAEAARVDAFLAAGVQDVHRLGAIAAAPDLTGGDRTWLIDQLRLAGLLVLLYAQKAPMICQLTTAHVIQSERGVALKLQQLPLELPEPLDSLVLQLVDQCRDHPAVGNEHDAPWLFPSQRPARPLTARRLGARLRTIGLPPGVGRKAALLDLSAQMPPAVLHRLLGISIASGQFWSAGANRNEYAAELARRL